MDLKQNQLKINKFVNIKNENLFTTKRHTHTHNEMKIKCEMEQEYNIQYGLKTLQL